MSEYTKGPWKHADAPEGCSEQIYAPQAGNGNGGLITVISSGVSKEEDIANAHLISAAPEMYEALEAVKDRIEGEWELDADSFQLVLKALAKAERRE